MPSKITIFYHDNLGGFSESWRDNVSPPTGYPIARLTDYMNRRMIISGRNTIWDYIRVSDIVTANARKVKVYRPTDPGFQNVPKSGISGGTGGHAFDASDFAGTRLMVRKTASTLEFARVFLAGFPDNIVDDGGKFVPNAQFSTDFALWATTVKNNGWGWTTRTGAIVGSPSPITGIAPQGDNTLIYTAQNPIFGSFAALQKIVVRVNGQLVPGNLNRSQTVSVVDATHVRTLKPIAILPFVLGVGKISVKTPGFIAVDTLNVEYVAKRGPGRPFGLYRGRQSIRPQA